jgi:hypothetical protein
MENKMFYVKYLNKQAVPIDTHYNGEQERKRPLSTVADLIPAYKTAVAPLLDSTPIDELTIHLDANGEALEADQIVSAIIGGHTAKTPLVIKSQKDTVLQEPSPVSSERPITPEEEKHLQRLIQDGIWTLRHRL